MTELFYIIAILIGFLFILKRKNRILNLLYLYVFSLPFFGLMYDIGVQINLDRIWCAFMFGIILVYQKKIKKSLNFLLIFLIYAFVITFFLSQFLPETVSIFPPLRGKYRYIQQIFMWILLIIPVFYISLFVKTEEDIKKIYKTFFLSLLFLSLLGIFQWLSVRYLGYDPFPIGILSDEEQRRYAMFEWQGREIYRINSLGGEPKHYGYSIAHILPLLLVGSYLNLIKIKYKFFLFFIFFINLFLTFSSQGYILFTINFLFSFILLFWYRGLNKKLIISIFFIILMLVFTFSSPDVYSLIKLRTIERFSEESLIEDFNMAILGFLIDNPQYLLFGVGLGNIHLYSMDYIPIFAFHYMYGNVFVAKSGFLRIISEIGIIGFVLFLLSYLRPLVFIKKMARYDNHTLLVLIFSAYSFISFLLSGNGPAYIFVALGILYWFLINGRIRDEN